MSRVAKYDGSLMVDGKTKFPRQERERTGLGKEGEFNSHQRTDQPRKLIVSMAHSLNSNRLLIIALILFRPWDQAEDGTGQARLA